VNEKQWTRQFVQAVGLGSLTDVNDPQQSLEFSTEEADEKGEMKASTVFTYKPAYFARTGGYNLKKSAWRPWMSCS